MDHVKKETGIWWHFPSREWTSAHWQDNGGSQHNHSTTVRDLERETAISTVVHPHQRWKWDWSTISLPHGTTGDSGCSTTSSTYKNKNHYSDSHRCTRMMPDSQMEEVAPTAQQQLHRTNETVTTLLERIQRHTKMNSSSSREAEFHVRQLVKRRLPQSCSWQHINQPNMTTSNLYKGGNPRT